MRHTLTLAGAVLAPFLVIGLAPGAAVGDSSPIGFLNSQAGRGPDPSGPAATEALNLLPAEPPLTGAVPDLVSTPSRKATGRVVPDKLLDRDGPGSPDGLNSSKEGLAASENEQDEIAAAEAADAPAPLPQGDSAAPAMRVAALPPKAASSAPGSPGPAAIAVVRPPSAPLIRPQGLRVNDVPVPGMPGVYMAPTARIDCLPTTLRQVLVDTASRFGHVAILNARRGRGSGARESYHYRCRAVDFRVRGVPPRAVYAFLGEQPQVGGRKIYPLGFLHIDDGPRRSW